MTRNVVPVPESPVRLRVNGLRVATWTCTPAALEALAAGRLTSEGFISAAAHIQALRVLPEREGLLGVDVEIPAGRMASAIAEADHRGEHGCGPRYLLDCRPALIRRDPPDPAPPSDAFPDLFRQLYEGSASYRTTGGLHSAGLSDGDSITRLHEEVGRHNAVDKAIGEAVLDGADRTRLGLVTTARISGDIAAKAARAGLAWIASRSVPTTLALEIAALAGITIVARAASPDARAFAPGSS